MLFLICAGCHRNGCIVDLNAEELIHMHCHEPSDERDHATTAAKERKMHRWSRSLMQGQHLKTAVVSFLHQREQKQDDNDKMFADKQEAPYAPSRHMK